MQALQAEVHMDARVMRMERRKGRNTLDRSSTLLALSVKHEAAVMLLFATGLRMLYW